MSLLPATRLARALFLLSCLQTSPALAQQHNQPEIGDDDAVFFFGGRMTSETFFEAFNPLTTGYETNFILGAGYQHFVLDGPWSLHGGLEVGLAGRFGPTVSTEAWLGIVVRQDGLAIGNEVRISPSFTAGFSLVSGTLGVEAIRERNAGGSAALLFYLAPEIDLSFEDLPGVEFFWRIQHRSGGWGTLANMFDGANATVFGTRVGF